MGDLSGTGKPSWYITNTKVNSAFHSSGVGKSSWHRVAWLGLRRGAFTCVGWQGGLTLCDPIWQVTLRSCDWFPIDKELYAPLLFSKTCQELININIHSNVGLCKCCPPVFYWPLKNDPAGEFTLFSRPPSWIDEKRPCGSCSGVEPPLEESGCFPTYSKSTLKYVSLHLPGCITRYTAK